MKKLLYLFLASISATTLQAQFITTNPATTPVTIGSDLNLATGKLIKFNNVNTIKSFGTANFSFGSNAGNTATTGNNNILIGDQAGKVSPSGSNNVHIGSLSGFQATGSDNASLGTGTLYFNSGQKNTAVGFYAGASNIGDFNTLIGNAAGRYNKGPYNTFIGSGAGILNEGQANVFMGINAGAEHTTGDNNTFLGSYTKASFATVQRSTAIGFSAIVDIDDAIVIGNPGSGAIKVGIGSSSPTAKLHVKGGNTIATGVRFEGLPNDAAGGPAMNYIVMDAAGNLFRYTGTAPARQGVSESTVTGLPNSFNENWTLKNDFLFNKNKKGIIIGEGITALPKGYGMYVADGILTEKVKVAIKNSSDWADYVFNKDYKRMTLTEVEKYISVNKHLPNMASAAEMVSEGNDLAKTDAKLLEKIEELTLYMIEMKKENAQMKRQINTLKRKLK